MLVELLSTGISDAEELAIGPKHEEELIEGVSPSVAAFAMHCASAFVIAGIAAGESGAGLNRLPSPLAITPGCIPRNGVSKLIVPKMR